MDIFLWLRRFFTFFGILLLCSYFMCVLFYPGAEWPATQYMGRMIVFTVLGLLSIVVYYSKEELTPRAWWRRTVLHTVLVEAIYLPLAHYWQLWSGAKLGVIYAFLILLAKVLCHLTDYGVSAKTAVQINKRIRERRLEKNYEQ